MSLILIYYIYAITYNKPDYWVKGRLAQLVERLLYTQDVGGSNPSPPTTLYKIFRINQSDLPIDCQIPEACDVLLSLGDLPP